MMSDPFFMDDVLFQVVPVFIGIVFIIGFGSILFSIFKGIGQWKKNEESPNLKVPAMITSKRADVSRSSTIHHDNHHHQSSSTRTRYFVTFEFESGDRLELHVSGKEYGLLSEGDIGKLNFQGTRFLGFERNRVNKRDA